MAYKSIITLPITGNGSMMLVAISEVGTPISLTVDLGFRMADFVPSDSNSQFGVITWNFNNNTRTVNGAASSGNFAWSTEFAQFLTVAQPSDLRWGVLSGDSVTATSSPIAGRGWLSSGNPTPADIAGMNTSVPISNGLTNMSNFMSANNALGTHGGVAGVAGVAYGASTATSGAAYLGTVLGDNLGGGQTWSYLSANGASSNFQQVIQTTPNPEVIQIGFPSCTDCLTFYPSTFTFGAAASTLTWFGAVPIPEPSTYAMLLSGLVIVAFALRQRRPGA
jgi:hypothetical protein